jgi:hypothetical protein
MDVQLVCKDRTVPQLREGDFFGLCAETFERMAVGECCDNSGVGVISSSGMHPTRKLVRASIREWK